ncbi:unnamed protein product [Kluyveromyces dobzhanskii CBS 2104]|uniref:WGS project CCBQ000000000 data, contig 00012 n=1 Tax=Kluyveromyces dobzhanskii CBS 2104 TaxID=1427455 RepID=A0A0A8L0U7_9SACH|nr:unnamed protein product [Kluyveromyces dobzhanskii CBS 2104]
MVFENGGVGTPQLVPHFKVLFDAMATAIAPAFAPAFAITTTRRPAMWIINSLPEILSAIQSLELPPDVELSRLQCNSSITSDSQLIDANLRHMGKLLEFCQCHSYHGSDLSEQIAVSALNAAYGFEQLAQQIRENAYRSESLDTQQWQASTNYNKKAIGILHFVASVASVPNSTLAQCEQYRSLYQLDQQLSMVLLTISKMRTRLYPDAKDKYSKLLSFQNSDIQELSKVATAYAKLSIGCSNVCTSLQLSMQGSPHFTSQIRSMQHFLDSLSLTLLSIDKFDHSDDPSTAAEMIDAAIVHIKPILSKEQLNLIQNNKSLDKLLLHTKFWKESIRTKLKTKVKFGKNEQDSKRSVSTLHPFILEIIADFLLPLIMVLKVRYDNTNEFIFDGVGKPNTWALPLGSIPNVKGARYTFDGISLAIDDQSPLENLH